MIRLSSLTFGLLLATCALSSGQTPPANSPAQIETTQELAARLTAAQKQQFSEALNDGSARKYSEALAIFKSLLKDIPGDPLLTKFAADSAVNVGDNSFARDALKPIVEANMEDWQAVALLARACAQLDDKVCRDAAMMHMALLHSHGITPSSMQEYVVERVKTDTGSVQIYVSLEPFSQYKIHNLAKIFDGNGGLRLTATLESSDFDQPQFAKDHPKEAAAGLRGFSLDGYHDTGLNSSGQKTQTHYTFKFFAGQPSYDSVRQDFIDVANGKAKPISNRTGLVVP